MANNQPGDVRALFLSVDGGGQGELPREQLLNFVFKKGQS